jgi:excisionase family DNA binding protein
MKTQEPFLLSKRLAAEALSVSLRTVDNLIASKQIAVMRVGKRVLVPRKALEKFADRSPIKNGCSEV